MTFYVMERVIGHICRNSLPPGYAQAPDDRRRIGEGLVDHDYIQRTVFTRNWGERLRELLSPEDWKQRSTLCDAGSPKNILKNSDYFCVYPITVFAARIPA